MKIEGNTKMWARSSQLPFILSVTPTVGELFFIHEFRQKSQNRSSLALVGHVPFPEPITVAGEFQKAIGQAQVAGNKARYANSLELWVVWVGKVLLPEI